MFHDLPRNAAGQLSADPSDGYSNAGTFGKVKQRIDAGGLTTDYVYHTTGPAAGQAQTVSRVDPATGQAERLTYTYDTWTNSLGGSAVLLESVTHERRDTAGGTFSAVRTATYDYYTGEGVDAGHGRLADLKLVTIHDGDTTGDVIDHKYYRYYKQWGYYRKADPNPANNPATAGGTDDTFERHTTRWSDPFFNVFQNADNTLSSGIKAVVEGASYDRLVAYHADPESATDEQVKAFADNFYNYERWSDARWNYQTYANADFAGGYHYYTRYRVTEEFSQGAGCSTCSGGQGIYKFDYHINPSEAGLGNAEYDPNVWRFRTIEYLPDTTNADLNGDGLVDAGQWADNDRNIVYTNEFGQVVLKVLVDVSDDTRGLNGISRASRVVTVASTGHGLVTGDSVALNGAVASSVGLPPGIPQGQSLPMYDGVYVVTVVDADTFTYKLSHVPRHAALPDASKMAWSRVVNQWADYYRYNQESARGSAFEGFGQLVLHAHPSAVSGWDESYQGLVTSGLSTSFNNQYLRDHEGLIELYTYYGSTTATATTPGGAEGYRWQTKVKHGEKAGGSNILGGGITQERFQYFERTAGGATVYPTANHVTYRNADGTGEQRTTYAYTWFDGTTRAESVETTLPTATSAQNGPNSGDKLTRVYDAWGRDRWFRDGDGFIHHTVYDPSTGGLIKAVRDVDTSLVPDAPDGWTTPAGGGLHLTTIMEVDGLGRTTKLTDPNGNVTHTVYDDAAHEVRTYRGWDAATGTTTGPIEVTREYRPAAGAAGDQRTVYTEVLTATAAPAVGGSAGSYVPTGAETIDAGNIASLTRVLTNDAGQAVETDAYFSLAGVTYTQAGPRLGTASNDSATGNYHATKNDYDGRGRPKRVETAGGTITRTLYDPRGLMTQTWVGTDDTPTGGFWSPGNLVGANLVKVAENVHDANGNLVRMTQFPGGGADARVTEMYYDWRNRLNAVKAGVQDAATEAATPGVQRQLVHYTHDNRGRVTETRAYDADGVILADADADGVWDRPAASLLHSFATTAYDNRGRPFRSTVFSVSPVTGAVSAGGLVTELWRDRRGNLIKARNPGAADDKMQYDGAGRVVKQFKTDSGGDTTWSTARDVSGDVVLEQTETTYDAAGNPVLSHVRGRFHDATGTGELRPRTSTTTPSRSRYTAFYHDAADRLTHAADVGTNGGDAFSRPASVPARSDNALVTSYAYDAAGRPVEVTDPRGVVTRTEHDLLGRTTRTVEAFTGGVPSDATDRTTAYTYTGRSDVLTMRAVLPAGVFQETRYVYGTSQATGSGVDSNDVLSATRYPDPATGVASAAQQQTYAVNALGQRAGYADRRGTTHEYLYDVVGRLGSDRVTSFGGGVDQSVDRLTYAFDSAGRPLSFTSRDTQGGTVNDDSNIKNRVLREYNGFGQLAREYQSP